MEENKKSYLFYIVSVLVVVALGGVLWYGAYLKKKSGFGPQASINLEEALKYAPSVRSAPSGQLPKDWPSDFPLFGKIKIVQSQNQQSPGSNFKVESVVIFVSSQNVKDLYASYATWAKTNNWTLISGGYVDGVGSLSLSKDQSSVLFTINSYQKNQSMVNVYYNSL
ncbi:MAG: hypothetical protein UT37_C0013G0010 [Parcubacteria group bacterium GW2011_GWA2_39_18]|nr:MAG: hypothetical protein UT37_C0013G0010 [Parcubacteria group bacterium GW2011_GWA2_39_18]